MKELTLLKKIKGGKEMNEYYERMEELFKREFAKEYLELAEQYYGIEESYYEEEQKLDEEEREITDWTGQIDEVYSNITIDEDWLFEKLIKRIELGGKVYTLFVEPYNSLLHRKPIVVVLKPLKGSKKLEEIVAKAYYSRFYWMEDPFYRDILLSRAYEAENTIKEDPEKFEEFVKMAEVLKEHEDRFLNIENIGIKFVEKNLSEFTLGFDLEE
ncbi:hypothetical protein [Aquifex aeolicus]|uniref:Uncharacterized protein aq_aa21 n=1 Tax=Aquifex aeolicus (strain VF5) TaxID=224324 RepID=YZ21_AQUAE|nr:hypothetical protein [Aquifex aeolicus]O66412.1 RecName: Full=Uncharacterized protein aq_aa21 [Aquifex aeolicus VF5]AAC07964.1 putative protein [Aquifex aeolicus VF5]